MSEEIRDILPEDPLKENPELPEVPTDPSDEDESDENPEEPESPDVSYTAKEWLSAKMQVLDEDGVIAVLAERGISSTTSFEELSEKDKDLLMAGGLLAQILLCGGGSTVKDVDGSWSHSEGGWQITKADKQAWIDLYTLLCRKWGETNLLPQRGIRVHARGMRVWRRR